MLLLLRTNKAGPCARGIECTYPDDLMLAHRGYQDFRFQFESPFCSAQTASLANCKAGDLSKCSNSLPFCLCLFNKNITFCQTFLFSFDKKYLNKTQLSQKCDNTFVKPLAESNFKGSVLTKTLSDDFAELKVV